MAKYFALAAFVLIFSASFAGTCHAEGLGTLSDLGKDQDEMAGALKGETKNFLKVKDAVTKGDIKIGISQDLIRNQYGDPVVAMRETGSLEKWVYKPGHASYFDKNKIYLLFDENKLLKEIKIISK